MMTLLEVISLIASIASLVLAIIAIWLSVVFYKMSSQLSESTREAAKGIGASVERLEVLFDKLYADTFSMMKDTYSDMRKHIWTKTPESNEKIEEEAEKKANEKVESLKQEVQKQIERLLSQQKLTDVRIDDVKRQIEKLVEKAIVQSRQADAEAREETIRNSIIKSILGLELDKGFVEARQLVDALRPEIQGSRIVRELERMRKDGLIKYEGERVGPSTKISLI